MELRVLQYFLAVAREESILGAANVLHVTQPTLSRQIKELEEEFGKQLFIRGSRKISLTDEGLILRQRATEIIELVEKTELEITTDGNDIKGNLHLGCPDMDAFEIIAKTMKKIHKQYPGIKFHIHAGDGILLQQRLDSGVLDFAMMIDPVDVDKYDFIKLPKEITKVGLIVKKNHDIAGKDNIKKEDLKHLPLLVPRLFFEQGFFSKWSGLKEEDVNVVAYIETPYDQLVMVKEDIGCAICINFRLFLEHQEDLIFIPLEPSLYTNVYVVWKKFQFLSKASECFLKALQKEIDAKEDIFEKKV